MSKRYGLENSGSRPWVIITLLFGMILASGCVFTPRDPEPPDDSDTEWVQPTEPEHVLTNIAYALTAETTTNYENSLDAGFSFIPNGGVSEEYFANWGSDKEIEAIEVLYTMSTAIDMQWGEFEIDAQSSDLNIVQVDNYQMSITYNSGEVVVFGGGAHFYMVRSGGIWKLQTWDESVNTSADSGGQLRVNLNL